MPVLLPVLSACVYEKHVLHPFFRNRFEAGPVRLASIVHALNYRIAVLRDGAIVLTNWPFPEGGTSVF